MKLPTITVPLREAQLQRPQIKTVCTVQLPGFMCEIIVEAA